MGYRSVPDYSVEFYQPPYNFLADKGSSYPEPPRFVNGGLSGACCSACEQSGSSCSGSSGVGLFDEGESWGPAEYVIVGTVAYTVLSLFFTGRRAVRAIPKIKTEFKAKRRASRRARLQRELEALGD